MSSLKFAAALLFIGIASGQEIEQERFLQDYDPSRGFKGLGSVVPNPTIIAEPPSPSIISPPPNPSIISPSHEDHPMVILNSAVGLTLKSLSAAAVMLAVL